MNKTRPSGESDGVSSRQNAKSHSPSAEEDFNKAERIIVKNKLAAIVESSDDAIISKTLDGVVTSWNQAAEKLYGFTAEEAIGNPITIIIPRERLAEESEILAKILRGESISHFETQRSAKDGTLIDISLTVSPIRDGEGRLIGASKIARDITDRKVFERHRDELLGKERTLREEAQRINKLKDDFLATLSHELRTPLNAIMGWAQLLRQGTLDAAGIRQAAEVVERSARTQKQLIDDLLDMNRIISGKLHLNVCDIDGQSFVRNVLAVVKTAAEAKGVALEAEIDSEMPHFNADPERLQQIAWNLVTNAIKFTPKGGKVTLGLKRIGAQIKLAVTDTGQGIAPNFLPHLFERFRQADSSVSRRSGGLGLGLSIVKQLVELHGGTIAAESPGEGKGATFTAVLPVMTLKAPSPEVSQDLEEQEIVEDSEDSDRVNLSGIKVLVVEDHPDGRELLTLCLRSAHAEVVAVDSGAAGLAKLKEYIPDIIISDIAMPEMTGYEFLLRVKSMNNGAERVPAIALTAFARTEDRSTALRSGFVTHLAKPADPAQLLATVATHVLRN